MVPVEYADRGWPVFPLAPRTKIPLKGSRGLYDATCERDRIGDRWSSMPEANIGLRTGLAFDVMDVDAHHGGFDTLADIVGGDDLLVACGPCVRTPNGGAHLYFLPTGSGNRTGIARGIDWRGDGGYVVAPPSVTRDGDYTWHVQNGETFNYDRPLVPVPKLLRDLVGRAEAPNIPSGAAQSAHNVQGNERRHPIRVSARGTST
jgi:Bifunctional DNA primase/polymerase, N-terminal